MWGSRVSREVVCLSSKCLNRCSLVFLHSGWTEIALLRIKVRLVVSKIFLTVRMAVRKPRSRFCVKQNAFFRAANWAWGDVRCYKVVGCTSSTGSASWTSVCIAAATLGAETGFVHLTSDSRIFQTTDTRIIFQRQLRKSKAQLFGFVGRKASPGEDG